jgi:cobalamin biosynthesis protein CobC
MTSISRAKKASSTAMVAHGDAPLVHGGNLAAARRLFPDAPEPFIDLSTGINPYPYPLPSLPPDLLARLPEPDAVDRLAAVAAQAYGAPSAAHVVASPGTQILLPFVAALVPPGRTAVLGPTYAEHARAAALYGHVVSEATDVGELGGADLAMVANPNNPDGRIVAKEVLLACAAALRPRNGLLVIDEAFMDVGSLDASLAGETERGNIVVLRSFGKFFGLAGLRLGFAVAAPALAAPLRARLGPWAVSGPALAIGTAALSDRSWIAATRASLEAAARRLDGLLTQAQLDVVGGTSLFRLARTPAAPKLFDQLGRAGILVRRFINEPTWLRFGLPGGEAQWQRLRAALDADLADGGRERRPADKVKTRLSEG